jgi:hypothetical protein
MSVLELNVVKHNCYYSLYHCFTKCKLTENIFSFTETTWWSSYSVGGEILVLSKFYRVTMSEHLQCGRRNTSTIKVLQSNYV